MSTRQPAVAGSFYPADPEQLKTQIKNYIASAKDLPIYKNISGIISPHAGYVFSGPIAANSFKAISHLQPTTVIILSPSHQEYFQKFSIFPGKSYRTPLGDLKINNELREKLLDNSNIIQSTAGHHSEHALEVQLPFLQEIYTHNFDIVPIVIGDVDINMMDSVAETLTKLNNEEDFLVIASSDLSHFHSYGLANQIDGELLELLSSYDLQQIAEGIEDNTLEACGIMPIYTLMKYASLKGDAKCEIIDYRNSRDTAGDKFRVVGYGAGVIYNQ